MIGPNGPRLRVVQDPERPSLEEVRALWARIRLQPIPPHVELRRLVIRGRA